MDDLTFIDKLQRIHTKMVGYFPTGQFKGYIEQGAVLIAYDRSMGHQAQSLGYIISKDRYLKRDELGVIYQLNVVPGVQRKLVGASLVKSAFERSAYGCRLYCCWCAQDIQANYFWQSLGFVPIAFRAGSTGKKRVHIFWQRRVHQDDFTTGWWYPYQTNSGAIRQDRLVFPIPPGVDWRDVSAGADIAPQGFEMKAIQDKVKKTRGPRKKAKEIEETKSVAELNAGKVAIVVGGRIRYVSRPTNLPKALEVQKPVEPKAVVAPVAALPVKVNMPPAAGPKFDPALLLKVRELRDRFLERVEIDSFGPATGKYEVGRISVQGANAGLRVEQSKFLPAA